MMGTTDNTSRAASSPALDLFETARAEHLQSLFLGSGLAHVLGPADDLVERVIEAIEGAARTGKIGDGKIFVSGLTEVVRIRTGERDEKALD